MAKGILWAIPQDWGFTGKYPVKPHTHLTLQYGVNKKDWKQFIGITFCAELAEVCHNDLIEAVKVRLPADIHCQNVNPHITISHQPEVKPYESNAMLESLHKSQPINTSVLFKIEFLEWDA